MTKKKKRILVAALVIWILGAICLASRTLEYFRGNKHLSGGDDTLTLENLLFPSRKMRDQE